MNFFEGLKAICDEGGSDHQKFFLALLRQRFNENICVGLDPWLAAEARLKSTGVFFQGSVAFREKGGESTGIQGQTRNRDNFFEFESTDKGSKVAFGNIRI